MEDDVFTENGNKTNKVNLYKKNPFQYTKARVLKVFSDLLAFIHSLIYNIYNVGEMLCPPPPLVQNLKGFIQYTYTRNYQ